jgi:hypothetical protein
MTTQQTRAGAILLAILIAAALRLVPHPANFTPIGAMALFGGATLGRRWLAFAAPLGALLLSDLVLGFYRGMEFQYLAVALTVVLAWVVISRRSVGRIALATVVSALLFFIVSNAGTWWVSGMYPHTQAGLAACYVAAIPFFQNSLAGDLFYAVLLFGGFALAERSVPALRLPQAATA